MKNIKDKENIKDKKKGLESMREAIKFLMQKREVGIRIGLLTEKEADEFIANELKRHKSYFKSISDKEMALMCILDILGGIENSAKLKKIERENKFCSQFDCFYNDDSGRCTSENTNSNPFLLKDCPDYKED